MKTKELIPVSLVSALIILSALYVLAKSLNSPVVEMSWSTRECVRVLSQDARYSCENLPKKYEKIWSK